MTKRDQGITNDDNLGQADDTTLLAGIARQDRYSFEIMYFRYHRRLARYLYRFTKNIESVEEIINDVMYVVWQKANTFNHTSRVSTWILGIAHNKALKAIQKNSRHHDRFQTTDYEQIISDDSPDETYIREKDLSTLTDAMAQLSTEHREVIELTFFHGHSYSEVAEIADCPVNTVKTRMFHARRHLKKLYKPE